MTIPTGIGLGNTHPEDYSDAPTPAPDHMLDEQLQEPDRPPLYGDVAALLAGTLPDPPRPTILARDDGNHLFYEGLVNVVFGDPESGKTWLALAAVATQLRRGAKATVVDLDHNGMAAIVTRLLDLGAPTDRLTNPETFRYYAPEDAWELYAVVEELAGRKAGPDVDELTGWQPAVAVFDSIGELLPMLGKNSNDNDEWTAANRNTLQRLANAGTCVIGIDHLAKNSDSRQMGQTGAAGKRRSIGGVSVRVVVNEQFTPGRGGSALVRVNKDRNGGVRATAEPGPGDAYWGMFTLSPTTDDQLAVRIVTPKPGDRPVKSYAVTDDDLAEIDGLSDEHRRSQRTVQKALGWGGTRALAALNAWREMNR